LRSRLDYENYLAAEDAALARRRKFFGVGVVLASLAGGLSMLSAQSKQKLHTKGHLHPWLHLVLFSVLGALAMLSAVRARTRLLLVLSAVALGLTIEYTEAWRFQAPLEVMDIYTDIGGTLFGAFAAWLFSLNAE
jgi:hypothetical protein